MQLKVGTPSGTVCASYLRDGADRGYRPFGIHAGLYGMESVVSLEYSDTYGGLVLIVNHDALDACKIKLVSRVGGWEGRDIIDEYRHD